MFRMDLVWEVKEIHREKKKIREGSREGKDDFAYILLYLSA